MQLCRYGYLSLQDMRDRVDAVRSYNIPFDVAYADIDYMERYKDFTVDSVCYLWTLPVDERTSLRWDGLASVITWIRCTLGA